MTKSKLPLLSPKARYYGELNEPIELPQVGGWLKTPEQRRQERDKLLTAAFHERRPILFEHYDLAFGDFERLALELAIRHVPGFTWRRGVDKGRPQVWSLANLKALHRDMEAAIAERPMRKVADAARIVARRDPWAQLLKGHKNPAEVLRTKYFQMMKEEPAPDGAKEETTKPQKRAKPKKA